MQLHCLIYSIVHCFLVVVIQSAKAYFLFFYIFSVMKNRILDSILLEFLLGCKLFVQPRKLWIVQLFFCLVFLSPYFLYLVESYFLFWSLCVFSYTINIFDCWLYYFLLFLFIFVLLVSIVRLFCEFFQDNIYIVMMLSFSYLLLLRVMLILG